MLFASILSRREESCLSESGHSLRLQEHSKTLATNSKATAALTQINTLFTVCAYPPFLLNDNQCNDWEKTEIVSLPLSLLFVFTSQEQMMLLRYLRH